MTFFHKYLKYKQKYLKLKKIQEGGVVPCDKAYKNILGTCWAVALQTVLCFGLATSNDLEIVMKNIGKNINKFIDDKIQKVQSNSQLNDFFPKKFFKQKIAIINLFFKAFIVRYRSKVLDIRDSKKPAKIKDIDNPKRCELLISTAFRSLFDYDILKADRKRKEFGGGLLLSYLFINTLTIFLLGHKVSFKNYYNDFTLIDFDDTNDLGIIITIYGHECCLFNCNGSLKYYNDNDKIIYNHEWKDILKIRV
jgi:hypothetical protein